MCDTLQLNWKLPNPLKPYNGPSSLLNNNNLAQKADGGRKKKANGKYGLRGSSIQKRNEVEDRKGLPKKRGPKPRPKPQPMSKYRRKTANLRERLRMGEINTAFDVLRSKIPTPLATNKARCEKLTKINILHVAINYIRALQSIIDTGDAGVQVYGTSVVRGPFSELELQSEDHHGSSHQVQEFPMTEKTSRIKNPSSSSMSSLSNISHSSSEDSGIADEEMEREFEEDYDSNQDEPQKVECPDWTELTSTLDFPCYEEKRKLQVSKPRLNLDTLLSTAQPGLTQDMSDQNFGPKQTFMKAARQCSFSDFVCPDPVDLLADLNALENSLGGNFEDISFVQDGDPFQIFC